MFDYIQNIKLGDKSLLTILNQNINDISKLNEAYSIIINEILASDYWSNNKINALKIKWQDGDIARSIRNDIFSCSGIYLWGASSIPRYIGKTVKLNFNKRFSRYIWQEISQCKLALKYEKSLIKDGIKGFPKDIIKKCHNNNWGNARLNGAVDFARHGINNIWFTLFPTDNLSIIDDVEMALIKVANSWNIENGLKSLINEQYK